FTDDLVSYGVQSFHAPTSTYSEIEFTQVFAKRTGDDLTSAPGQFLDPTPSDYSVSHYPDPVRSSANIVCALHCEALVTLEVYDVTGRKMITLVEDHWPAGYHTVAWNGRDERGNPVSAGVYFYRLLARPVSGGQPGVITVTKKMIKL
ncbi:MAG: Ig domain protein group 2 domain protein, partial [Bacteroidetes bacterium]|nr:Ig domain protein group 2 domain protein [Bacteroidota bacterium]